MAQVTVVIPTYNRAHTLERAIGSVLSQKEIDFDLMIVDDGSTDNTSQLLEKYSQQKNLTVLNQSHVGVSQARNFGVSKANGSYIAFLDSDDEWLPGKLKAQYDFLQKEDYRIVQTKEIWIRNGIRVNPPNYAIKKAGDIFAVSLQACMITPSSVMLEKSLFEEMGGFDTKFPACEDYALWLKISACYPIGLIEKDYLRRYGGHTDQLSAAYPAMDRFRIQAIVDLLEANILQSEQKILSRNALQEKLRIYQQGCTKREKWDEVAWCESIKVSQALP